MIDRRWIKSEYYYSGKAKSFQLRGANQHEFEEGDEVLMTDDRCAFGRGHVDGYIAYQLDDKNVQVILQHSPMDMDDICEVVLHGVKKRDSRPSGLGTFAILIPVSEGDSPVLEAVYFDNSARGLDAGRHELGRITLRDFYTVKKSGEAPKPDDQTPPDKPIDPPKPPPATLSLETLATQVSDLRVRVMELEKAVKEMLS